MKEEGNGRSPRRIYRPNGFQSRIADRG